MTGRLRRAAAAAVGAGQPISAAVASCRMSWPAVLEALVVHADRLLAEPDPVRVLGIDEARRGRPKAVSRPQRPNRRGSA